MTRIGLLDGIHRQGTNSIGKVAAGRHDELLWVNKCDGREAEYSPRCAPRQQCRHAEPPYHVEPAMFL